MCQHMAPFWINLERERERAEYFQIYYYTYNYRYIIVHIYKYSAIHTIINIDKKKHIWWEGWIVRHISYIMCEL